MFCSRDRQTCDWNQLIGSVLFISTRSFSWQVISEILINRCADVSDNWMRRLVDSSAQLPLHVWWEDRQGAILSLFSVDTMQRRLFSLVLSLSSSSSPFFFASFSYDSLERKWNFCDDFPFLFLLLTLRGTVLFKHADHSTARQQPLFTFQRRDDIRSSFSLRSWAIIDYSMIPRITVISSDDRKIIELSFFWLLVGGRLTVIRCVSPRCWRAKGEKRLLPIRGFLY